MENNSRVELLAPAGNAEGFYGAIHAGADAVYLGGSRFGARAYAENFTTEELVDCIRYGHLLGRKIYLTVNTLLKESELTELYEYINPFYEAGLDAVIVQDMGVLRFIREHFPGLELHASTQMTLCSSYGARLLKQLGASRLVPARELSLKELSEIRKQVDIQLETFIHGAMCYCYSGQCLFSSILGGRSGNRGRCAQPCRLPYKVRSENRESNACYPLSLKDMCTIEHIPQLIEAGIHSFKIEGRMKKPEYTAGVTSIYRKYIDLFYSLREQFDRAEAEKRYLVAEEDIKALSSLYIRSEKQDGYYFKHNGKDMVTLTSPAYSGNDERLLEQIRETYLDDRLRIPVTADADFRVGNAARLTLQTRKLSVTVQGERVQQAQKQPVTEENIRKQLGKMGDSAFRIEQMAVTVDENAFYPLKQMNELRRLAVCELEKLLFQKGGYGTECTVNPKAIPREKKRDKAEAVCGETTIAVSVRTISQLQALTRWSEANSTLCPGRIYLEGDLLLKDRGTLWEMCESLRSKCDFYVTLPYIIRMADETYLKKLTAAVNGNRLFRGFLVRSLDGLQFALEQAQKVACRLDANVYTWNSEAVKEFAPFAEGFCLPLELKGAEQRHLMEKSDCISWEKPVYGRIPMMLTANCLQRTAESCRQNSDGVTRLVDRYHKEFPVVRSCSHCMNVIYNCVPLSLHQELAAWRNRADLRLDFTIETETETEQILNGFFKGKPLPYEDYTTGHEKRGVE